MMLQSVGQPKLGAVRRGSLTGPCHVSRPAQQASGIHHQRASRLVTRSAAASPSSDDPYKVLGIARDADTNAIARAYRLKKYEARGNDQLTSRIENAHGQLMLNSLNSRLKNSNVASDVRFADQEPLFPWKPKRWDATPKVIMIIGLLQLGMAAYGFQAPSISKAIACMAIGIAGNVMKQNAISPPPKDRNSATEEEEGRAGRNFVRGALLGLMATFGGVLLFSAPEMLKTWFAIKVPAIISTPGTIVSLKVAGAALCNWIMTSYYY